MEENKNLVVVETIGDTLAPSAFGFNVAAADSQEALQEALQEAKRNGAERVSLILNSSTSAAESYEITKTVIEAAESQSLPPFVCSLPLDEDGQGQDVTAYLGPHSAEQLQSLIDGAFSGEIISQIWKSQQREEDFQEEIEAAARQDAEASALFARAYTLSKEGNSGEALAMVADKIPEVRRITKEAEFARLLALPTLEEISARRKEKPSGIRTGYAFTHGNEQEELLLPSGALTFICAPTSHGKSRFLENLALILATDGSDGTTLYFSYEESQTDVETELLNIFANVELSANNLRTLGAYYRDGDTSKIKGMNSTYPDDRATAQKKLQTLRQREVQFSSLLTSGKIRVFYEDYDSSTLIEFIRFAAAQTKVRAVFIDYIQLLHKKGSGLLRKDELKEICKDFMNLAIETKLPIVMAAQLNRETYSPLDMAAQNIAEASDIEHSANTVLLLWNSRVKPISMKNSYYTNKDEKLSKAAEALEARGFNIGTEGKLYATLAKNRGGARGIDAIFDFNGNTGKIEQNYGKPEPQQSSLPFAPDESDKDRF